MYVVDIKVGCETDPVAFRGLSFAQIEDVSSPTWFRVFKYLFDAAYLCIPYSLL